MWNSERYSRPRAMNTSESGCCHSTLTRPPESPSALAVSGRLMIGIFVIGWPPASDWRRGCGPRPHLSSPQPRVRRLTAEWFGQGEDVVDVVQLDAGGGRGPADEVEHPAVFEPVVGQPLNSALLVEVDRDHPLVGDVLVQEGEFLLGALGNVIEHLAADGGDGGGRAEHDQHLLLAGAEWHLLERAFGRDVA